MRPKNSEVTAVTVAPADPRSAEAQGLLDVLSETLAGITGSSGRASFDVADVEGDRAQFLLARDASGRAVGCGAYRAFSADDTEIKRMLALPGTRGVGAALLTAIESAARADGYETAILETRRVNEHAVAFYRRHGYTEIANFGRYVGRPEAICMAKKLAG
jgi:ribosomal protein S18 acetylase RimI-like enzyme